MDECEARTQEALVARVPREDRVPSGRTTHRAVQCVVRPEGTRTWLHFETSSEAKTFALPRPCGASQ